VHPKAVPHNFEPSRRYSNEPTHPKAAQKPTDAPRHVSSSTIAAFTSYQIAFASWMHYLRFRKDARIWQDEPADEILTDIFNMHPQARSAFRLP
jgi:hypothetical protein